MRAGPCSPSLFTENPDCYLRLGACLIYPASIGGHGDAAPGAWTRPVNVAHEHHHVLVLPSCAGRDWPDRSRLHGSEQAGVYAGREKRCVTPATAERAQVSRSVYRRPPGTGYIVILVAMGSGSRQRGDHPLGAFISDLPAFTLPSLAELSFASARFVAAYQVLGKTAVSSGLAYLDMAPVQVASRHHSGIFEELSRPRTQQLQPCHSRPRMAGPRHPKWKMAGGRPCTISSCGTPAA